MPESRIGLWLARHRRGSRRHLVESEVAGDVVTRCGRRMAEQDARGRGLHPFADHPNCETCSA